MFSKNKAIHSVLAYGKVSPDEWAYVVALPSTPVSELPFRYDISIVGAASAELTVRVYPENRTVGDVHEKRHVRVLKLDPWRMRDLAGQTIMRSERWLDMGDIAREMFKDIPKGTEFNLQVSHTVCQWWRLEKKVLPIQRGQL